MMIVYLVFLNCFVHFYDAHISSMAAEDCQALWEYDWDRYSMHRASLLAENRQHMQKVESDIRRQLIQDESRILSAVTM